MNKSQILFVGAVSLISASTGSFLTYYFTKRTLQATFEKISQEEIAQAKIFYSKQYKTGTYSDPISLVKEREKTGSIDDLAKAVSEGVEVENEALNRLNTMAEILRNESYSDTDAESTKAAERLVEETIIIRTASSEDENFVYAVELMERGPEKPYVISWEEFNEGEDYQQTTLTYYHGDDMLVDERDEPVNIEQTIGRENLQRFGHGSGDPNVVYIRHEKNELDFEVQGLPNQRYDEEVLGHTIEHSDRRGASRRERLGRHNPHFRVRDDE